ncbi:ankyrin repeat-containing domain protein, partial [Baffinella frigidus]
MRECSALHRAAYFGSATVVRVLIAAGAEVSAQDTRGMTPLHYAVSCGHDSVSQALLEHGAQASAKTTEG